MQRITFAKQFLGARKSWRDSWSGYGGWRALLTSPYLWLAFLFALGCNALWLTGGWWNVTFSIVPSVLGFSIGGFAIFLSFGDARFRYMISGPGGDGAVSPFLSLCFQFAHFISVQVLALVFAVVGKALFSFSVQAIAVFIGFCGILLLFYSMALALAAVGSLLKLARSFDRWALAQRSSAGSRRNCCCSTPATCIKGGAEVGGDNPPGEREPNSGITSPMATGTRDGDN